MVSFFDKMAPALLSFDEGVMFESYTEKISSLSAGFGPSETCWTILILIVFSVSPF